MRLLPHFFCGGLFRVRFILLFWLLVVNTARADIEEFLYFFPDANLHLGAFSSEYTAFDEAFDVLDYLEKIGSSSRPQSAGVQPAPQSS